MLYDVRQIHDVNIPARQTVRSTFVKDIIHFDAMFLSPRPGGDFFPRPVLFWSVEKRDVPHLVQRETIQPAGCARVNVNATFGRKSVYVSVWFEINTDVVLLTESQKMPV
jgi:hypothetical protein